MNTRTLDTPEAMQALGARLAAACPGQGLVIHLRGPLGSGKTTLVRGFLRGLGHRGPVPSPSFALVEPYAVAGRDVVHVDLYRVTRPEELEFLGLEDLLSASAVLLVEWPEHGAGRLPPADLVLRLDHAGEARSVALDPVTEAGARVLAALGA